MPGGTVLVWKSFIATSVPLTAGVNTFWDQIGSVMCPTAGGATGGSGMIFVDAGWPAATAPASPARLSVTVLRNSLLRETLTFGPSNGVVVVVGSAISTGGVREKSGISMTVPS